MRRLALALAVCVATPASANDLPFDPGADPAKAMPELARAVIAGDRDPDRSAHLETVVRAQLAADDTSAAATSLTELLRLRASDPSPRVRARDQAYAIYARSLASKSSVDAAFRAVVSALDAKTSSIVVGGLAYMDVANAKRTFDGALARQRGKTTIAIADAIQLVRAYADLRMVTALAPRVAALTAEDDARRYVVAANIVVPTPDGSTVCAFVVRPRGTAKRPAILEFTIYNDARGVMGEARMAAAHDYAGVVGLTRGKGCSSGPIVPYEHDGADADTVIDWIAAQPWSDGRVGMHGGSYSGFTPWAAAKHRPAALKAIMMGAPVAPGIDVPMEGNVFWSFIYPWPFYTTDNKTLDDAVYGDHARWERLDRDWYTSGRAYRDHDKIDGTPNPIFDRWLEHPAYDAFWQDLVPTHDELAHLGIPALITAGYYFGGPGGATGYFDRYQNAAPNADVYLVIGPYGHFEAQRGLTEPTTISGYALDPAALVDLVALRFEWFDFIFKGTAKPALLADRVNYEVPGANAWKHARSLAAVARATRTFFLNAAHTGATYQLTATAGRGAVTQTIDFTDRRDVDQQAPGGGIEDTALDATNGVVFASDPFPKATELSGMFSGQLDVIVNKRDFDFQVSLYELTREGHYIQLAPYWSRASYVADPTTRHLLVPGQRQSLAFHAIRMMSRAMAAGSRLIVVVNVIKESGREINYGTGKSVEDETIADAKPPLVVQWLGTSSITIPVGQ